MKSNFINLNLLVSIWLATGFFTSLAGLYFQLSPFLILGWLSAVVITLIFSLIFIKKSFFQNRFLTILLTIIWLIHFTGVFVPETGFDAVWYHLPVAREFIDQKQFVYLPEYYQSLNPYFVDSLFLLGYWVAGMMGAKMTAYTLSISLILVLSKFSEQYLSVKSRLWFLISVSLFQVISWQASSFYIDTGRTLFDLFGLLMLSVNPILATFSLSASLASKTYMVVFIPVYLIIIWLRVKKNMKSKIILSLLLITLPAMFYFNTYQYSGDFFYSLTLHEDKISQISTSQSLWELLLIRTMFIYQLPYEILTARDYTSPLIIIFLPFLIIGTHKLLVDKQIFWLTLIGLINILAWWYLPPLSSRYFLSGFILILFIEFWLIQNYFQEKRLSLNYIWLTTGLIAVFFLAIRLSVLYRNLPYLLGQESQYKYIERFIDGNIDVHLKKWYQIE